MDCSNIKERVADISRTADLLVDELTQLRLPEPSFENGLPAPLLNDAPASNASDARIKLLHKVDELRALLTEPTFHLTTESVSFSPTWYTNFSYLKPLLIENPFGVQLA